MRKTIRIASLLCLALLLVALPLISACGDDDEEKEKPEEIVVAFFADLSGPLASSHKGTFDMFDYAYKYINEVEGGIDGAKLVLRWVDTQSDPSLAISGFRRAMEKEPKPVLAYNVGTMESSILKPEFEKEQVPCISSGHNLDTISPPGWVFTFMVPYADQQGLVVDYIMENWTEDRPPKMAYLCVDVSWGHAGDDFIPYAEAKGMEIQVEFFPMQPIDVTAQLLRIRDWGADFVFIHGVAGHSYAFLGGAERLGMLDEFQFICGASSLPYDIMELAGSLSDGQWILWWGELRNDMTIPINVLTEKIAEHATGSYDYTSHIFYDVSLASVEALKQAVAEVGLENLDGPAVYRALETFDWDPLGAFGGIPYHLEPGKRVAISAGRMYEMRGGELIPLTETRQAPRLLEP